MEILGKQIENHEGKKWFMIGQPFFILQNIVLGEYNEEYNLNIDDDIMDIFFEVYSKFPKEFLFKNNKMKFFDYRLESKKERNFSIFFKLYDNRKIENEEKNLIEKKFEKIFNNMNENNNNNMNEKEEKSYKNLLKLYINNMTIYANKNLSLKKETIEELKKKFENEEFLNSQSKLNIFILEALITSVISDLTDPLNSIPDNFEYFIKKENNKDYINKEIENLKSILVKNSKNMKYFLIKMKN